MLTRLLVQFSLVLLLAGPTWGSSNHVTLLAQADPTPPQAEATPSAPTETPSSTTPAPTPAPAAAKAPPEEEEREVARVPNVSVQQGGILLPPDTLVVEPSLSYTYATNTRLILSGFSVLPLILLGTLESEKTTTQYTSPVLSFRYGLIRNFQLDVRFPAIFQTVTKLRANTQQAGQIEENSQQLGMGDISFGLSYQLLYERGWKPDVIVRVGATAPTGRSQFDIFQELANDGPLIDIEDFLRRLTQKGLAVGSGRWRADTNVTAIKAVDPAIIVGSLGYSYTPGSTESLIQIAGSPSQGGVVFEPQILQTRLGPVSSFNFSIGLTLSLNRQLSMNFAFADSVTLSTSANGQKIPDSHLNVGQLILGMNMAITPRVTVYFSGQVGITRDAPDMAFAVSVPIVYPNAFGGFRNWFKKTVAPPATGSQPVAPNP